MLIQISTTCSFIHTCTSNHSLSLWDETLVEFDNMVAYEPDQVGKVGSSCLVVDVLQHGWVINCNQIKKVIIKLFMLVATANTLGTITNGSKWVSSFLHQWQLSLAKELQASQKVNPPPIVTQQSMNKPAVPTDVHWHVTVTWTPGQTIRENKKGNSSGLSCTTH